VADAEGIIQYIPHLRRYARALTGDQSAADDLVQDTLERAWTRFVLWRPNSNIRAWLFTIMHNIYVNQLKAAARARPQAAAAPMGESAALPAQENWLELRDLSNALQRLPYEQREVVLLIGLEQLSYEEAARVLGIPIGTVMSRLSRGREQLRLIMNRGIAAPPLKAIK
jgi:RNA polymerase sigma-70 factor (ECF subfamily)